MLHKRFIPRLDIKGPNLVKGIHMEGLRALGSPSFFAQKYYNEGADELLFVDVVASLDVRNSLHEIISETAKNIFIPITVGGGIRSLVDIKNVLRVGADKVAINTAATKNPQFIEEAVKEFGSSTIVITIEAIKHGDEEYYAYTDNGREYTGLEVINWAKKVEDLGCGEIIITSVDREGTGKGLDLDLVNKIIDCVSIPVIAHGGIGDINHITNTFKHKNIESIAASSIIHYDAIDEINKNDINEYTEGNFDYILKSIKPKNINSCSIIEIKSFLKSKFSNIR